MKALLIVSSIAAGAVAGAATAHLVGSCCSPEIAPSSAIQPAAPSTAAGDVDARVDALSAEIDALRMELASVRSAATREPAPAAVEAAEGGTARLASASPTPEQRATILKVIEDDRKAKEAERDAERKRREEEQLVARAARVAKQFNLNSDEQKKLADVYAGERARFEEMRTLAQNEGGFRTDPAGARDAFREIRDWRTTELSRLFGADLGAKIDGFENERARGGGGRRNSNNDAGNGSGFDPGTARTLRGLGYTNDPEKLKQLGYTNGGG